jgi:hypothetical protein
VCVRKPGSFDYAQDDGFCGDVSCGRELAPEFRGQKALNGMSRNRMAGVLRLRALRSAQDDGFVVMFGIDRR